VLAQHRLRQVSIGAVAQDDHLPHGLLQGDFSRRVGCLRNRSGLEAVLPLERLLGGDCGCRVAIRVSDTNSDGARPGRIVHHQGTHRDYDDERHQPDAGPGHRPSIPRA